MHHRSEIDGLRALAVVPVILFHAGFASVAGGGFVGVDVFFVISGYLVTGIILADHEAGAFSLVRFYERRARRILPALVVVVTVTAGFAWLWLLPADLAAFWRSLLALSVFSSNVLFWQESGYFDSAAELKPLLHTWSLAVEEQYYLLFPPLVMALRRLGRRGSMAVLAGLALASLALSEWATFHKPVAAYYLLPTRGWELLVGSLIAFHRAGRPACTPRAVGETGGLLGLGLLAAAVVGFDASTPFPGLHALVPTLGAGLIVLFATPRTWVGRLLGTRPLVGVGLVSYSAYLWHQPLFALARHRAGDEPSPGSMLLLCGVSLALAAASWRWVEQPFRNGSTFSRREVFGLSAGATAALSALGLLGSLNVLAPRYDDAEAAIAGDRARWEAYTWARMDALQLQPFRPASRKVLVVGDSQAADFVNILHEARPAPAVSFSTYTIPWSCPNLYLPYSVVDRIEPAGRAKCAALAGYRDPRLRARLRQADEVWLVSAWQPWNLEHLGASLRNLRAEYGDKFAVVGQKSFRYRLSQPALRELARAGPQRRSRVSVPNDAAVQRVNGELNARFGGVFLDVESSYCRDGAHCRLFDDAGELIAYDGTHVTPAGARFAGRQLARHPRLRHLFDAPADVGAVAARCNRC